MACDELPLIDVLYLPLTPETVARSQNAETAFQMVQANYQLIGRGVYSIAEAHRLTGVPKRSIRRWTQGYEWKYLGGLRRTTPVVVSRLPEVLGDLAALDFADLLEVRFLHAFRSHGVSWKAIKIAAERAREILGLEHPFSSRRFSTDGHTILAQFATETGDSVMLDLVRSQYELGQLIDRYLRGEIDFGDDDAPRRWWPFPGTRRIVIDPARALGAPILDVEGVPTRILAQAVDAEEGSITRVADLFEVDPRSVEDALKYERSLED